MATQDDRPSTSVPEDMADESEVGARARKTDPNTSVPEDRPNPNTSVPEDKEKA